MEYGLITVEEMQVPVEALSDFRKPKARKEHILRAFWHAYNKYSWIN